MKIGGDVSNIRQAKRIETIEHDRVVQPRYYEPFPANRNWHPDEVLAFSFQALSDNLYENAALYAALNS